MKQDSHLSFGRRISPCKDRQAEVGTWTASRIKVTNIWFKSRGDWWKK